MFCPFYILHTLQLTGWRVSNAPTTDWTRLHRPTALLYEPW